jgi:hypothetical protein
MTNITVEGFSRKQKMLADIIWALDTREQVTNFIRSLPRKDQQEAEVVCQMLILAFIDECEDTQDAERVIQRVVDSLGK